MAASYAPRIDKLEKDQIILRKDHDYLRDKVEDRERGLEAAHRRLDDNEVLAERVNVFIRAVSWLAGLLGASVILLIWNIIIHAVEIVRP